MYSLSKALCVFVIDNLITQYLTHCEKKFLRTLVKIKHYRLIPFTVCKSSVYLLLCKVIGTLAYILKNNSRLACLQAPSIWRIRPSFLFLCPCTPPPHSPLPPPPHYGQEKEQIIKVQLINDAIWCIKRLSQQKYPSKLFEILTLLQ